MQIYLVGGAVRDALLGLPLNDRDWVVVGSTPEAMVALGYLPVGRDFPVFLHPQTHEEYALARTERKTAPGYRGFEVHAAPGVTLEEDLARRDISINAMAYAASPAFCLGLGKPGEALQLDPHRLIDPFGGQADLQGKLLRHITPAFREDPVRILRVARFAARFADFSVADETLALMRAMVADGEVSALVPERVWQEISKGLMAVKPSHMMAVLQACGAMPHVLPQPKAGAAPNFEMLDAAAAANVSLSARFACLYFQLEPQADFLRRVPHACGELAQLLAQEHTHLSHSRQLDATGLVQLLERCDALRRPQRFLDLIQASNQLAPGGERLLGILSAAQSVSTASITTAARLAKAAGPAIGAMIREARIGAVSHFLTKPSD